MSQTTVVKNNASNGAAYGLGMIGAAVYYLSSATSFMEGVVELLKSLVWPTFVVHAVMKYLGM